MIIVKNYNTEKTIIHFHSKWSIASLRIISVTERLSNYYKGIIEFLRVELEEEEYLIKKFNIKKTPTLIMFVNGLEKCRIEKYCRERLIIRKIKKIFNVI
ncbi:thioredoxin domain-containing protein [Candidatus Vidania fulgoroideorum]